LGFILLDLFMKNIPTLILSLVAVVLATFLTSLLNAAERPHVILIMVDDMGFSDLGYHGGEIDTPNLDGLARGGVRFSQFYNSGRCCPTRATLMTGLHPHQTGIGHMTQAPGRQYAEGTPPAYQGYLNRECATIAEVLKGSGYATLMSGKWHLGNNSPDRWPLQRGFDKYYGCISGATRFFYPEAPRDITFMNEQLEEPESTTDEAYYTTDAFTDYGMRFIGEHLDKKSDGDPFFLYLAYTAPHWPLQAFEDDIAKYRGKYKVGWDKLREQRFAKQIELGLIDEKWSMSPKVESIPDWDTLDAKKQDEMDLKMAVYAAMVDRVDQNIGKLIDFLQEKEIFEDTLIMFLSDNGGCQEGGMLGRGNFYDIEKRNLESANSYGEAWANASNTPFRLYKHFVHEGGAATPFFLHWPAGIKARESWYETPAQLIDLVPTILDVAGATYPKTMHGNKIPSLDGISLRPSFGGDDLGREDPIFVEHENNAFVRDGDWKLVGKGVAAGPGVDESKWELYNIAEDRTELNNLREQKPELFKKMAAQWDAWSLRAKVYPKKTKVTKKERVEVEDEVEGHPHPPQVTGRAFTVSAEVRGGAKKPLNGVVVSHGGLRQGYALHFIKGKPVFSVREKGKLTNVVSPQAFQGEVRVVATLTDETISLKVNDKEVASVKSPGLLTGQPGIGLYSGLDWKDPVGDYQVPNKFGGRILKWNSEVFIPKVEMRTPWAKDAVTGNAWNLYPRPQFRRKKWTNLNGLWNYAVTGIEAEATPEKWDGEIRVPFAIEAPLSGVEERFTPEDALWYQRSVEIQKKVGKRYHLNFEAVDYKTTALVNGKQVGENRGGNMPFTFDITDAVRSGENEIVVKVTDATDKPGTYQLHGKQRLNPRGIWYTPVSGIWQTVWLEEVPEVHLTRLKITTKISGRVAIEVEHNGAEDAEVVVTALQGEREIAGTRSTAGSIQLSIPNPMLWSPGSPYLYNLDIKVGDDVVRSYLGVRETGIEKDEDGHLRFTLNGKTIFHWGTLDQGWWPDGLLTPPSEEAMVSDIIFLKEAGFNVIRKHIKVEPRRYYYECDKIGMMVWQDQVSHRAPVDDPEWTRLLPTPEKGVWPEKDHQHFMSELKLMIDTYYNHPSIVQWVPFNERWGQHNTQAVGDWNTEYDPSRQVNVASGGNFFPSGHIVDAHRYPHPEFPFDQDGGRFDGFVKVMGEFGGHGFPVDGHVWDPKTRNWGYGGLPEDKEEWLSRYRTSIEMLKDLQDKGIAGGIYTQTTDVEGEINGLITYDREVQKVSPEQIEEIGRVLFE
jgi:arylsulfatase